MRLCQQRKLRACYVLGFASSLLHSLCSLGVKMNPRENGCKTNHQNESKNGNKISRLL